MVVQRKYIRRGECECCGSTENLTTDHITPKAFEGNKFQTLCLKCNHEKGTLTIDYRTKTMEITPWMMSLNKKGLELLLTPSSTLGFSGTLFCIKSRKYIKKYLKSNDPITK